jgi:hypothetical protein
MIKLGYAVGSGEEVGIKLSHLIVTGITQLSGKTTTLEALIKRSNLKAIVFKTKIGEKSFTEGTEVAPFFRDRSDYEFVKSLIEAYAKEKLFLEKGTLMELSKGANSLIEIKRRIDDTLTTKNLRGIQREIYIRLQHYLENLIPQIQYANLSKVLVIHEGINIMNLERFTEEAQSLIIESVADEVLKTMKDVIIVIPEAWKFIPQKYNNPCKRVVESFIRQGATNNNFIWIDSQDMAGVDKIPLKQISIWVLGFQAERNEVKHTLDQISLPKKLKPKEDEIMTLRKGHFFVSSYDGVVKAYVQPIWMDDLTALSIAKGEKNVDDVKAPDNLIPFSVGSHKSENTLEVRFDDSKIRKEMVELRIDVFNKIQELQNFMQKISEKTYAIETKSQTMNEDEIVSKVIQKMPMSNGSHVDLEEIVKMILPRIPKGNGSVTYTVSPIEKITKDFLEESKSVILTNISKLNEEQKKMLKYIETQATGQKLGTIIEKCLFKSQTSGGIRTATSEKLKNMASLELIRYDAPHGLFYPSLKDTILKYCGQHGATTQEIEQVYNHILMAM